MELQACSRPEAWHRKAESIAFKEEGSGLGGGIREVCAAQV